MGHLLAGLPPENKGVPGLPVVPPSRRQSPTPFANQHSPQRLAAQRGTKTLQRGSRMGIETLVTAGPGTRNFFGIGLSCVTHATGIFGLGLLTFTASDSVATRLFPATFPAFSSTPVLPLPAPSRPLGCLSTTRRTAISLCRIIRNKGALTPLQQAYPATRSLY